MGLLKTKHIGNKQFESECIKCGEVMLWQEGDDTFAQVFENGDMGLLCSKCYDGPRANREKVDEWREKREQQ